MAAAMVRHFKHNIPRAGLLMGLLDVGLLILLQRLRVVLLHEGAT